MLIGALLRVPAQAIQRRLIKELNAAGFDELRLPHMAVLQFPGPDGVRPGALAERAGMSKQAMNQLLRSLEGFGYIVAVGRCRTRAARAWSALPSADTPHTAKMVDISARHRAGMEHRTRARALRPAQGAAGARLG